jgi:diaminobutyrate acetyltransferase (EC 2.3.1.178)
LLESRAIRFHEPIRLNGKEVYDLVKNSPPLDENSMYCNFLQCEHFSDTSVCAKQGDTLVGFISAYLLPNNNNTLFIWQVAISKEARGQGLALKMIEHLLERLHLKNVCHIETTITHENQSSWRLFEKVASALSCEIHSSEWLNKETHFQSQHSTEMLVKIGPFQTQH